MTFTINLTPELEARLAAQAQAHGKLLEDYLREAIEDLAAQPPGSPNLEEWDRLADELTDEIDPSIPPLSDYAASRESIYFYTADFARYPGITAVHPQDV